MTIHVANLPAAKAAPVASIYGAPLVRRKNAMLKPVLLGMLLLSACAPSLAATPVPSRLHEITDADTRAWWQATEVLSNDGMEGRDIGSAGYDRAAKLVASRFAAAGLKPAGDNGSWLQSFKLDGGSVDSGRSLSIPTAISWN